jgi:hypothetical protein
MSNSSSPNATDRIVAQSSRRQRERAQIPVPRNATIIEGTTKAIQNMSMSDASLEAPEIETKEPSTEVSSATNIPQELDLEKGTTIRLQRSIFRETKLDGVDKDYNRDTFFEAAWLTLKDYPEVQEIVIAEAQRRSILRRQVGRTKAAKTMGQKVM